MTNFEKAALQAKAYYEVSNVMCKYEYALSHSEFDYVYNNLFALDKEDVFMELPFGHWHGPDGIRRCMNFHKNLQCEPCWTEGKVIPREGVMYYNSNSNPIIEIAGDLKTAKGIWVAYGENADKNPDGEFEEHVGSAIRYADFVYDEKDSRWKIWHYGVVGWTSNGFLEPCTNTTGEEGDIMQGDSGIWKFPADTEPDSPPKHFWQYGTKKRPEYFPRIPDPYDTWTETFGY